MSIYESKMRCLCSLVDLFQGTTALLDQTLRIGPGWGTGSGVAVHRCSSPDQSGLVVSYVSNVFMSCSLFFLNFHPWYEGWSSTAEIVEFWVPTTSWCPSAFSGVRWFNSKNEHHELCRLIATPFISIYVKFQHVGFHGQPTCFPAKLRRGHGLARQQLGWLEAALKILELRRTYRWCDGPTQWAKLGTQNCCPVVTQDMWSGVAKISWLKNSFLPGSDELEFAWVKFSAIISMHVIEPFLSSINLTLVLALWGSSGLPTLQIPLSTASKNMQQHNFASNRRTSKYLNVPGLGPLIINLPTFSP